MADFPIVKIPQRIQEINNIFPPLPLAPLAPSKPEAPKVPLQPTNQKYEGSGLGSFAALPVFLFGVCCFVTGKSAVHVVSGLMFFVLAVIILYKSSASNAKNSVSINLKKQEAYEISLREYDEQKRIFELKQQAYAVALKQHESDKLDFNAMVEKLVESNPYKGKTIELRRSALREILAKSAAPIFSEKKYTSGVSENQFFYQMLVFFERTNITVLINHTAKNESKRQYMPDFVISLEEENLNMIVEIDEPYVGKNGMPIHFANSHDLQRDSWFLNRNWIVLRFAEEQIIKNPIACICHIVDILRQNTPFTGIINESILLSTLFGPKPQFDEALVKIPQWTKEQAREMAAVRYRNNYLPEGLLAKIKEEDFGNFDLDDLRDDYTEVIIVKKKINPMPIDYDDDNDLPF